MYQIITPTSLRKASLTMTQAVPLVLIVEDDTHSMYLMERYTRTSGCRALGTTKGENVLALAREKQPAVIFLDLMLPGMTGWEVLQALKADPVTRPIPVIICTALNEAERALEEGAGYLRKPILYQDFITALKNAGIELPKA